MGMRYGLVCGISGGTPGACRSGSSRRQLPLAPSLPASWSDPDRGLALPQGAPSMGSPGEREGEPYFHFRTRMWSHRDRCMRLAPRRAPVHEEPSRACERTRNYMRPKKTILCVDQNEQALAVRKFMLTTRGYRVVTALSGHDALEIFRNGGIDLVLSDLLLPEMDGNEMVRRMKDISPEIPTILLSATIKNFERANRADAFLPKGACNPGEVLERIRVMIARKRGPKKAAPRPVLDPTPGPAFDARLQPAIAS